MKNLVKLYTVDDVIDYTNSLWKTPEFQASAERPGGLIHEVTRQFATYPRLFFEYTDAKMEKYHFVNMFNLVPLRDGWYSASEGKRWHSGDAVQDLFYLHEIYHVVTRDYVKDIPFDKWVDRWYFNEKDASLMSEVLAYFHFPSLREKTFIGEIWADRFLENRQSVTELLTDDERAMQSDYPIDNHLFFDEDPEMFRVFLTRLRLAILLNERGAQDDLERSISRWLGRNLEYYKCWRDDFQRIENRMVLFHRIAEIDRFEALEGLVAWLQEEKGHGCCPFEGVAAEFNRRIAKTRQAGK
jgi:hypothetical protein